MIPILWAPAIFSRSRISQYWNGNFVRNVINDNDEVLGYDGDEEMEDAGVDYDGDDNDEDKEE